MITTILDIPPEILQNIVLYATCKERLGPPKELHSCLLTCRAFNNALSPRNANNLHFLVFGQKFDTVAPICRLSEPVVREHAPNEIRRRFEAIRIFKSQSLYHPDLTEALWISYLMVEDTGISQKNLKQLIPYLPAFLDKYLRDRLYEGAENNGGWPVMSEQNCLALALSWSLASKSVMQAMSNEHPEMHKKMMNLVKPIVFAAFRYCIFHTPEALFTFSGTAPLCAPPTIVKSAAPAYPSSITPPKNIRYFGELKRQVQAPSAAIFATLLYFAMVERVSTCQIPPHVTCPTREEANQRGGAGLTVEDIRHFNTTCGTPYAKFPGFEKDIHHPAVITSPDTILGQPSLYKLGNLTGEWNGSTIYPGYNFGADADEVTLPGPDYIQARKPLYVTLVEHYCYDEASVVPCDDMANGTSNAWLPPDLQAVEYKGGMQLFDGKRNFNSTYETFRHGVTNLRDSRQIADVIITGKTNEPYITAWGGPSKIIGRVRLYDGLMVLVRYSDFADHSQRQVLRGYVTSSSNLVGRIGRSRNGDATPCYEGVFSLGLCGTTDNTSKTH